MMPLRKDQIRRLHRDSGRQRSWILPPGGLVLLPVVQRFIDLLNGRRKGMKLNSWCRLILPSEYIADGI